MYQQYGCLIKEGNMKKIISILLGIIYALNLFGQNADQKIGELINSGNWFELEREYANLKNDVQAPILKMMSEVMLASYFNRPIELREKLQQLLNKQQEELGFSNVCNMTIMGATIEGFEGNYSLAADMVKGVADLVQNASGSLEGTGLLELYNYYNVIRELPAPTIERPLGDVEILFKENSVGLLSVPVQIKDKTFDFIIDTGASFSVISSELANTIQAKIIDMPVYVEGANEDRGGYGRRAFIDVMQIGVIKIKNIIALVNDTPDINDVKIDAVLGMDFLKLVNELQINYTKSVINFPLAFTPLPSNGRNIILDHNVPLLSVTENNQSPAIFKLDSGNIASELSDLWYSKNLLDVEKYPIESIQSGSFGGIVQYNIVRVPQYEISIGGTIASFEQIPAKVPATDDVMDSVDGNLGVDLIKMAGTFILNFKDMFFEYVKE